MSRYILNFQPGQSDKISKCNQFPCLWWNILMKNILSVANGFLFLLLLMTKHNGRYTIFLCKVLTRNSVLTSVKVKTTSTYQNQIPHVTCELVSNLRCKNVVSRVYRVCICTFARYAVLARGLQIQSIMPSFLAQNL